MNKGKPRVKTSKQNNTGRQTSIRSFFSTNFRKTIACENNSRNTSPESKSVIEIRNKTKIPAEDFIQSSENERAVLSLNVNCSENGLSCSKTCSNDGASEKRKFETSGDVSNLLDELESSSSEDYVYLQSFTSKNHNTSPNIGSDSIKKRMKLSPSSSRNEKEIAITNNIIKTNKLCGSNQPRNENTTLVSFSGQNQLSDEVLDIENLGDLFNDDCDEWSSSTCNFNLNEWTYCTVKSMQYFNAGLTLTLQKLIKPTDTVSSLTTTCVLRGCWFDTPLKVGDIVCLKAHFEFKNSFWVVDNEQGFITVHPDVLITGTGVVGSLFCQRRSVLSYIFPSFDPPNEAMIVGSLVHELLQEVLRRQIFTMDGIRILIDYLINAKRTLYSAYECDVTVSTIRYQLEEFAPKILSFVNTYINGKSRSNCTKMWSGDILEVLSIEENFWIPQLGIKGKTDVILKARKNDKIKILPLELKTGRASNSSEHRGQIILYLIMMDEVGTNVDGGLLFYLRENKLTEINPKHAEKSGLIGMRNSLVSYIVANETPSSLSQDHVELPTLPEPINHPSGCAKCPYLTVCSASITKKHRENTLKRNPLIELSVKALAHLTESHIRYIFFWLGLLKLEESERKKNRTFDISDLWHVNVVEREGRGYCVSNLRILSIEVLGSRFVHKMKRITDVDDFNLLNTYAFAEGDYIVVSRGSRYAIACGYIEMIEERDISLKLDRMLEKDCDEYYVVDKYSKFDGLLGFNTSSLLLLFEDTIQACNLRSFIIDAISPSFTSKIPSEVHNHRILDGLNVAQKNAILKTLKADHYMLIKGMPGTGKTATIVSLIKLLVSMKYSVLITSHTHSAVDNILLRLKGSDIDFLRLGTPVKVHDSLKDFCEDHVLEKNNFQSVRDLENFYNKKQVIAVTCMGCSHVVFRKRQFDYCIVDEATQVLLPTIIKSLYCCKKFVLIGDPDQLPPVVQSKKASLLGLSESLFKRLDGSQVTSILNLQYRMNSRIMQLANSFAYKNKLECANEEVGLATILSDFSRISSNFPEWMKLVLSSDLNQSIVLLNTSNLKATPPSTKYSSRNEAEIAFSIVRHLHQVCETMHDIGIIAPFCEQVKLLRGMSTVEYPVEINTVDQYQGRDRDVIIYSCSKTSSTTDIGILSDKRRLTVAITRAKRKLIIIADVSVLRNYVVFDELFNLIPKECIIEITHL